MNNFDIIHIIINNISLLDLLKVYKFDKKIRLVQTMMVDM